MERSVASPMRWAAAALGIATALGGWVMTIEPSHSHDTTHPHPEDADDQPWVTIDLMPEDLSAAVFNGPWPKAPLLTLGIEEGRTQPQIDQDRVAIQSALMMADQMGGTIPVTLQHDASLDAAQRWTYRVVPGVTLPPGWYMLTMPATLALPSGDTAEVRGGVFDPSAGEVVTRFFSLQSSSVPAPWARAVTLEYDTPGPGQTTVTYHFVEPVECDEDLSSNDGPVLAFTMGTGSVVYCLPSPELVQAQQQGRATPDLSFECPASTLQLPLSIDLGGTWRSPDSGLSAQWPDGTEIDFFTEALVLRDEADGGTVVPRLATFFGGPQ